MAPIRIPKKTKPVPKPKRKPGTRAGLTKPGIAAAAAKLFETGGPGEFSVRKLASDMGVGPTSIHAHFKGGTETVLQAVAAQALSGTTRPFKPKEEPAEYLRELFLKILQSLHARPAIARLVIFYLSSNPILDPFLAERLLLTLAALGVQKDALPATFQRAMGVILELILTVSARSEPAEQKSLSAQMTKAIAALPSTEFPNLTELREALVAETVDAAGSKPSPEVAALYVDRLVGALAPG
jgi:AcrR family transcriptional regulator